MCVFFWEYGSFRSFGEVPKISMFHILSVSCCVGLMLVWSGHFALVMVLSLIWSPSLIVLALSQSWHIFVLVVTWSRLIWSWLQQDMSAPPLKANTKRSKLQTPDLSWLLKYIFKNRKSGENVYSLSFNVTKQCAYECLIFKPQLTDLSMLVFKGC